MDADRVVVELVAKSSNFDAHILQSRRNFDTNMKAIQGSAANAEKSVNRSLGVMGAGFKGFLGAFSGVVAARAFLAATDAAKKLEAQLRLATTASGNFAKAQDDVRRIAQATRTGLVETASLYATFQRNANELGISQEQAARATETVSKAFQISGASAAEAAGGLRQFLQGVQSGALRGEELNSVLENAPRLARLLADSLGVTIGQLRKLGEEGKLSGDKLIKALTDPKFTKGIDAEFKQLPVTFDQAVGQIKNAAIITFGAFDRGGEFSNALVNFITDGTGGFADLAQAAENLGIDIRATFAGLSDVFEPLWQGAKSVFGLIDQQAISTRDSIASLFGAFDDIANILPKIGNRAKALDNSIFGTNWQPGALSDTRNTFLQGFNRSSVDRRRRMILSPDAAAATLAEFGTSGRTPTPRAGGATSAKKGKKGPSAETLAKRAKAEADRQEREDRAFRAETASLNVDIIAAKKALVTSAEIIAQLETQAVEERARDYADEQATRVKLGQLTEKQAQDLIDLNAKRVALEKDAIQKALRESQFKAKEDQFRSGAEFAQAQKSAQADLLRSQEDLATTAAERHELERQIIDLQFQEERLRNEYIIAWAERVKANKDATEAEIQAAEAAQKLAELQISTLEQRQDNAQASNDRNNATPLQDYFNSIPDTAAEINEAFESIVAGGLATFTDALTDAIVNFRSLGDVGRAVLQSITAQLVRMAIQQLILHTIGKTLGMTATAATTAQAAAAAAAWAPAAAAASLATLGANAGPAAAALASTHALSAALAIPKGFQSGGYTGSGSVNDAAGIVHGKEYVFDAEATRRIGVGNLEAIRKGVRPSNGVAASPGGRGGVPGDLAASLRGIVTEAIQAMPDVALYPTLDSGEWLERALASPRGSKALVAHLGDNSGTVNGALQR